MRISNMIQAVDTHACGEPGRVIEKEKTVNALDFLMAYLPQVEGAIRGCQSDSAAARNRSNEVKEALSKNNFSEAALS